MSINMLFRLLACASFFVVAKSYTWWIGKGDQNRNNNSGSPNQFIRNFLSIESSKSQPYVSLRLQLEKIADEHGLYNGTKNEDQEKLEKLFQNREVQNLIQRCNKFHKEPKCNTNELYRRPDGTCNNLKHPLWGASDGRVDRFLPAEYQGIRQYKHFGNDALIPKPRIVSKNLIDRSDLCEIASAFFTFFGQLLVHDMTLAPICGKATTIPCCQPRYHGHPDCSFDILVREDDPFYSNYSVTCLRFSRSAPFPECNFQKRSPMNKITSFIDASFIYGSNETHANKLRANDNTGRIGMQNGGLLLANKKEGLMLCPINQTRNCFIAGDDRVNQHTMLASLTTMMTRLHNQIAVALRKLNPHWNGEKIFQEARRIVAALFQHMVYTEYLPLLIGQDNMVKYNLLVDEESWYNEDVRPFVLAEFNTAAIRLHSMVPTKTSNFLQKPKMRNIYAYFEPLHRGTWSANVAGSCEVPSENNDAYITKDVTQYLIKPPGGTFGFDLASINIQRGRDHGLPPYVDVVKKCLGLRIKTFSDLKDLMTTQNIKLLKSLYGDVKYVDLWIGMIHEINIRDSLTGPTAACINSIQFNRAKYGDSFFFTHKNGRYPFTRDQLQFIREYSLSRLLCDTLDYSQVRKRPLLLPYEKNPIVQCNGLPLMNLKAWKEKKRTKKNLRNYDDNYVKNFDYLDDFFHYFKK